MVRSYGRSLPCSKDNDNTRREEIREERDEEVQCEYERIVLPKRSCIISNAPGSLLVDFIVGE